MSITNRAELEAFILAQSTRTDAEISNAIPSLVSQAETMIARDVRAIEMIATVTLGESDRVSNGVYLLPSNYLGMRGLFSSSKAIEQVSLADIKLLTATSPVAFYTTYGFNIEFRGIPGEGAEIEVIYFARPDALPVGASPAPTALLLNHSDLYIHAALYLLFRRIQDVEMADRALADYQRSVASVNSLASAQRGGAKPQLNKLNNLGSGGAM